MLLHAAASSQDFLHVFSSDTFFDEAPRYISPEPASHAVFANLSTHLNFPPAVIAGEAVVAALINRIEIALLYGISFAFVHSVLKWLHHPLL